MIAQKRKGKTIELYYSEVNEIESFTLLVISEKEKQELMKCSNHWEIKGNKLISSYETGDELDKKWKDLAVAHKKANSEFKPVDKTFISTIDGSSMLIRDPSTHTIRIAYRKGKTCTINKIFIHNSVRDNFFADCKRSAYFNYYGKYAIDMYDEDMYRWWSNFMNEEYMKGVR